MTEIRYLYKYGCLTKHAKALFTTPKVFLCAANQLNDPFECRPSYSFDGSEEEVVSSFARGALSTSVARTEEEALQMARKLYSDGKHRDLGMRSDLLSKFLDMSTRRVGIFCLSEVPDSILMWSHYAASHTGYCIEFAASDSTPFFGEAQPVRYSDMYPHVEHFQMTAEQKLELVFLTKHHGWAYEREWRILGNVRGPGHYEYPSELMTRVIFGIDASEGLKKKIIGWTARRGCPVQFAQAVRDEDTFSINIQPMG